MKVLASDYTDKNDYTPIEILRHVTEDLPEDMKTIWESLESE
jgi:hypothetical protein